ncbi:MAG: UDP-galactopyranose mutase [Ferruginibacter sp.]|nr:UDP-galactopyranose mutase [Ferruginibacter sp.]
MTLDIVCFSHLRWNFVYQRPQHLLSRFAKNSRVFILEEPIYDASSDYYDITKQLDVNVWIVVPHLVRNYTEQQIVQAQKALLDDLLSSMNIIGYLLWYYSPMALSFSDHLTAQAVVYDCMDELSGFKFAHAKLKENEARLFKMADIVFTGGHHLYSAKKHLHHNIHPFPSSIDKEHFLQARAPMAEPYDQLPIPHPRIGFYGVVDERFNLQLLQEVAKAKPDWQLIVLGPVVKIDPASLPKEKNIHYLGGKNYKELPQYLSGWDIAMMPFAINESTTYISPTKTPEYLAGGKPVISTSIRDVVAPYGEQNLVHIADTPQQFIAAGEKILGDQNTNEWLRNTDAFLSDISWDKTWDKMNMLITQAIDKKHTVTFKATKTVFDYLIVGAGLAGATLAERLATQNGKKVLLIDKRNHIGGNTYDYFNNDGIMVHKYGPHIFHTNSKEVFDYLGKFTDWRPYEHRVLASVDGMNVPIPINLNTINQLYNLQLNSSEVDAFLESKAEKIKNINTSEDVVINKVGRELYEKFFKSYTKKQWGLDPSELDASVTARIPTRNNRDDRYFTDTFQAMPLHGYTRMFETMLNHPNIKVMLNTDYKEIIDAFSFKKLIYTGPIDYFFNYCYGKLPYRSLSFKFETMDAPLFQPTGTVNYPNEHAYTRITEFKYLTGQKHNKTSIVTEYPTDEGDPYYPIPRAENAALYKRYQILALQMKDAYFVGRLATYKYYNMDQVVAQALTMYKKIIAEESTEPHANGIKVNGTQANGTSANGTQTNGTSANVISVNGTQVNGNHANGNQAVPVSKN